MRVVSYRTRVGLVVFCLSSSSVQNPPVQYVTTIHWGCSELSSLEHKYVNRLEPTRPTSLSRAQAERKHPCECCRLDSSSTVTSLVFSDADWLIGMAPGEGANELI